MENLQVFPLLLAAVFLFFLFRSFRIIPDNKRAAELIFGKFERLVGPGLVLSLKLPKRDRVMLSLGQVGRYLGGNMAEFNGVALPIRFDEEPKQGVVIDRFGGREIWVKGTAVTVIRCEECGHANEIAA